MTIGMIFGKREREDTALFLLRWTARILSLAILFLFVLFAFGDDGVTGGITGTEFVGLLFFPLGIAIGFGGGTSFWADRSQWSALPVSTWFSGLL